MKARVISMWEYVEEKERKRELMKATQIMLLRLSFIHPHVILFLPSCQGLWLLDNCVHFPHRADSKGLLFSNNTIFLSGEYRRSHYTHKNTRIDTNTQICSYCIMLAHILTCTFTNTLTARKTLKFPRMWVCIQAYT